jgi:hypothetical protein
MSNPCAFCAETKLLTREHVWPRCLGQKRPDEARYLGKNKTFFGGDISVKDVCASCNNGPLSELDNYICALYDAQFHLRIKPNQSLVFRYNYDLLLRWLLKISFNSARANDTDADLLSSYRNFILKGGTSPDDVLVFLDLVRPSKNPNRQPGGEKYIWPETVRCARVQIGAAPLPGYAVRLVSLNAFYFYLVFDTKEKISPEQRAFSVDMLTSRLPYKQLKPGLERIPIIAMGRRMLDAHRDWTSDPQANRSMAAYKARRNIR